MKRIECYGRDIIFCCFNSANDKRKSGKKLNNVFLNKENLLFLQNRLPRTFNLMLKILMFHLSYSFFCFLFLLFSVSTVFCLNLSSLYRITFLPCSYEAKVKNKNFFKFLFFPVSPKTKKIGPGKKSDPLYRI